MTERRRRSSKGMLIIRRLSTGFINLFRRRSSANSNSNSPEPVPEVLAFSTDDKDLPTNSYEVNPMNSTLIRLENRNGLTSSTEVPLNLDKTLTEYDLQFPGNFEVASASFLPVQSLLSCRQVAIRNLGRFICGIFDGHSNPRASHFLGTNFEAVFKEERMFMDAYEPVAALFCRIFAQLNAELLETNILKHEFATGTIAHLFGDVLTVFSVGNTNAVLSRNGLAIPISMEHTVWDREERLRLLRNNPGMNSFGKIGGKVPVTRGFGAFEFMPFVNSRPSCQEIHICNQDEFLIIASSSVWKYLTMQQAVDVALYSNDLTQAAQKIKDFALDYGCKDEISVLVFALGKGLRGKVSSATKNSTDISLDTDLGGPVEAPLGNVALVFTDVRSSTYLWRVHTSAMRSAIKVHNQAMRRLLMAERGYEVKTEGDAFMIAFPNPQKALKWCLLAQQTLLHINWPNNLLSDPECALKEDDGVVLFKGLTVRMGIHYGRVEAEIDPTTRRIDYFGPEVNYAARIGGSAKGGQIFVSKQAIDAFLPSFDTSLNEFEAVTFEAPQIEAKGIGTIYDTKCCYQKALAKRHEML